MELLTFRTQLCWCNHKWVSEQAIMGLGHKVSKAYICHSV